MDNLIKLIKSAEIFRVREDKSTIALSFNQPTICILVYGELKYKSKMYGKSNFFMTD